MDDQYLLESPDEAARLVDKVDPQAWAQNYLRRLKSEGPILEVGCGPMHLLRAASTGNGSLAAGLDISTSRLRANTPRHPATSDTADRSPAPVCGDATHLPFRNHTFALTFARFVLEYLSDPLAAVSEMARVTRPGGYVLLQDLDGQLLLHHPVNPRLQSAIETFLERTRGQLDPNVGRKLYGLARRAGLVDISVHLEPYHLIPGAADAATLARWNRKLDNAFAAGKRVLGDREAHAMKQEFLDYLADPDTLTFSNMFTVVGCVP